MVVVNVLPVAQCHFDKGQAKGSDLGNKKFSSRGLVVDEWWGWVGARRARHGEARDEWWKGEGDEQRTYIYRARSISLGIGRGRCCAVGVELGVQRACGQWVVIGRPG